MNQTVRTLAVGLLMMLASLAGCLSGDDVDDDPTTRIVVASTFHVADIAEALGGSDVEVILLAGSTQHTTTYPPRRISGR